MILLLFVMGTDAAIFELEEPRDLETIYADMEVLRNNPLNINEASAHDLMRIPFLSIGECMRIVNYRNEQGYFSTIDELRNIQGFDELLIENIRPFLTVTQRMTRLDELVMRLRLSTDLPGESASREIYSRSSVQAGPYQIVVITERDAYEPSLYDYYAPGVFIREGNRCFAIGKYNLDSGTGIMLSPTGSIFRTVDMRIVASERGVIPYTSVIENGGFFGAALSDSLFLRYTIFYSHQKLDGRIDSLGFARSFDNTGDHIDSLSLSRKDRISEEICGGVVSRWFSDIEISARSYRCSYSPAFTCDDSLFHFYGEDFWINGCGLKYCARSFVFFSEWALSFNDKIGSLNGVTGSVSYLDFSLVTKYFSPGFYSPKGVEASSDLVEGVLQLRSRSKIISTTAVLTLTGNAHDDTLTHNLKLNAEKKIGILEAHVHAQWRFAADQQNRAGSRVFLRVTPLREVFFDVRLEEKYAFIDGAMEKGQFGAIEVGIQHEPVQLRLRYGLFSTESYASRIYAYEIDLPGIVNNRMLYGEGYYGFAYLSVKPWPLLKITVKYAMIEKDELLDKHLGCQVDVTF